MCRWAVTVSNSRGLVIARSILRLLHQCEKVVSLLIYLFSYVGGDGFVYFLVMPYGDVMSSWRYVLFFFLYCGTLSCGTKLYCQHGKQHDVTASTTGLGFLLGQRPAAADLVLCCGRKSFNSQSKICCFGEIISRTTMRCCPDGSFLPRESVCRCHPPSTWVVSQMKKMSQIERKHLHLIEELTTLIRKTKSRLGDLQNEIKLMDEKAQNLYDIFLEMIKIDRTETNEAEHVIEMIKFRNSLEEGGGDEGGSQPLSKMKREADEMDDGIEMIVMKRDQLLKQLSPKYWQVSALHRILDNEEEISGIATNDRQLMGIFRRIFDDLMTLVVRMETSLKQEYPEHHEKELESLEDTRMQLRRRLSEDPLGWSSDSPPNRETAPRGGSWSSTSSSSSSELPVCDFVAWTDYLATYESRILAIISDIRSLRRAFASHRYSTDAGTDTSAQLKRISSTNFLVHRYHRRFR